MSGGTVGLKYGELTATIIGTFYDVYNELGYGFLESVYEESLVIAGAYEYSYCSNPPMRPNCFTT
jgi:hypothetical protein